MNAPRTTRRQKKRSDKIDYKSPALKTQHFELQHIEPITENQVRTFDFYEDGDHLFLHGCAGTGKTFCALYLALKEISEENSQKKRVVLIRNAQSSKDIGFLPGNEKEKLAVYESAYRSICSELFHRDDAYDILKTKGILEFHSTSFLRGSTINDAIIIVDEIQNMRYAEFRTVLTRTGDNSRVILCGDTKQDDLTSKRYNEESGLQEIMKVFERMDTISTVQFTVDDIVRGGFVKSFIIAENQI